MQSFPGPGQVVMRILGFPLPEPAAVRRFTTDRRVGLGVVAEFMEEHVVEEDSSDPRLSEPRINHDRRLGAGAVTRKTDGRQPSPWAVASPTDNGAGQMRKPSAVDLGEYSLQLKPLREGFQHGQIYGNGSDAALVLATPDILKRLTQTRICPSAVAGDPLRQFTERFRMIQQSDVDTDHTAPLTTTQAQHGLGVVVQAQAAGRATERQIGVKTFQALTSLRIADAEVGINACGGRRLVHRNNREPIRRSVAPSATAWTKSSDIPMLRRGR